MRGSPHLHVLIWTGGNCPKLTSETKEARIEYINRHMYRHYNLPNKDDDPELYDVVNFYQNILIFQNL